MELPSGGAVLENEVAVPRAHERLEEYGRLMHDEHLEVLEDALEALLAEVRPPVAVAA